MQNITNWLNLPANEWKAALAFVGAGALVAVIVQVVKHFSRTESAVVARALVTGLSFVVSAVNYILASPSQSLSVIGSHTAMVLGAAHVVYWVSVSPAYKWFMGLLKDAESFRAQSAPQATTASEAPLSQLN